VNEATFFIGHVEAVETIKSAGGIKMQAITKSMFIGLIVMFFMSLLVGCSLEVGPQGRNAYIFYHKPLPEASRDLEEARMAGKDKKCPAEFNAARYMVDKAYQVYEACHTQEAIDMAQEAIHKIKALCPARPEAKTKAEEPVIILLAEPKAEKTVMALASTPKIEEKVIVLALEDIHFDFDKSTLTKEAQVILKRNIQILKENPKAKIRIAGYTSASGTEEYNQKLSERRANAVEEYLIKEGVVTPNRLSTIGYGEKNPAMYEATPKDLYSKAAKANMRVLFVITVK